MTGHEEIRKLPGNTPGKFYTTEECDGCAYCASLAPDHFGYEEDSNTYYVSRQPASKLEFELLLEAQEDCPLDAIQSGEAGGVTGGRQWAEESGRPQPRV